MICNASALHSDKCDVLLGILLLEESIMMNDDGDVDTRTAKRARVERPAASISVNRWIELAR